MASFFRKCSTAISSKDCSPPSNPSPRSPLDMDFEKETGVTMGLGLVPYLANLWVENPNAGRIAFSITIGLEYYARSFIRDSVANTYELITLNLNSHASLFTGPSTPLSLFSPLSHTTLIGSQPDLWGLPDDINELPFDPHYFLFLRDECPREEQELSLGYDGLIPFEFDPRDDDLVLSKSHVAHEEEDSRVIAGGKNLKPNHIYENNSFVEKPRSFVSGLSAAFGVRPNRPAPPQPKDDDDQTMKQCDLCKKPLKTDEQNDNGFFKSKYSCSCLKQKCKRVEVDDEEDWKKAFTMGPK